VVGSQPAAPVNNPPVKKVEDTVVIGLISPELGPYGKEGMEQRRAAEMASEEMNAQAENLKGFVGQLASLVGDRGRFDYVKDEEKIVKENTQFVEMKMAPALDHQ